MTPSHKWAVHHCHHVPIMLKFEKSAIRDEPFQPPVHSRMTQHCGVPPTPMKRQKVEAFESLARYESLCLWLDIMTLD